MNNMNVYDRILQREAEEWFEGYDNDTTEGYLHELTGEQLDEDDEIELYTKTGIF